MTGKTLRCAIYTRKSSEDGLDQDFNALDAQREACAAYIKSQASEGWKAIADQFDDGGFTGGNLDRPALKRLIGLVEAGRINVIVVYKIDRLTRSLADFARLVEILDRRGASFVSVTQQFNTTTSMGRLTLNVLLSFAQFEREVTSERIRDKVAASKRRGMWMGGRPPLGFDIVDRKLVINAREAETVQKIFRLALEARSLTRLEQRLADEKICAKRWKTNTGNITGGGPMTRTSVSRLLRNPIYLGKVRQGGELYDGEHDAIISEALWENVQTMLDDARQTKRPARNGKSNALLSGLVFDDAGNRMVPSHAKRGKTIYRYYVSLPLVRTSKKQAGGVSRISAPKIESEVIAALEKAKIAPSDAGADDIIRRIKRITLHKHEIEIEHKDDAGKGALLRIAANLGSAKNADRLIQNDGANQRNEPLIKTVALAYDWRAKLEAGEYPSVISLARGKGYSERYVWKVLRLAFLAPDIIEAILDGRQPSHLALRDLNDISFTGDWSSQRCALGFAKSASRGLRPKP